MHLTDKKLPMFTGPLLVVVQYRIPAPLSLPEKKRRPLHLEAHTKRPDGDNLDKFLNDALTGVLWDDDARIAFLFRSKINTKERIGETELFVRELDPGKVSHFDVLNDLENCLLGAAW